MKFEKFVWIIIVYTNIVFYYKGFIQMGQACIEVKCIISKQTLNINLIFYI